MKKILFLLALPALILISSCGEDKKNKSEDLKYQDIAYAPDRDAEIQRYNLKMRKERTTNRTDCDTIALIEYVLDNYPEGTYLVDFDKTLTYSVPQPAVIYSNEESGNYVFGVIAKSRPGERLVESKNIVGYDQSFIDLDSTELGTAFFYLTLFKCSQGKFSTVWESPIPSHGGFNKITMRRWAYKGIPFIEVNFHYGQGVGHINYNYFMLNGLTSDPHLLMTYKGINFQRTIANLNNDKFPDYYEYVYYDTGNKIYSVDSVGFVWNERDSVYVNTRNKRQKRPY